MTLKGFYCSIIRGGNCTQVYHSQALVHTRDLETYSACYTCHFQVVSYPRWSGQNFPRVGKNHTYVIWTNFRNSDRHKDSIMKIQYQLSGTSDSIIKPQGCTGHVLLWDPVLGRTLEIKQLMRLKKEKDECRHH